MYRVMDILNDERWIGMKIRYEKPYVDRVWLQFSDRHRLCLHKIYPLEGTKAFYHPHPWEFETLIVQGSYLSNIGCNFTDQDRRNLIPPPVIARVLFTEGSWYSIDNTNAWHTVEPVSKSTYSIVLIKKRWNVKTPGECQEQNKTMSIEEVAGLLRDFEKILSEKHLSLIYSPTKSPAFSMELRPKVINERD